MVTPHPHIIMDILVKHQLFWISATPDFLAGDNVMALKYAENLISHIVKKSTVHIDIGDGSPCSFGLITWDCSAAIKYWTWTSRGNKFQPDLISLISCYL